MDASNKNFEISVVSGNGTGKTLLSAFDAALKEIGVYNYNLIVLSSIIPPHSVVKKTKQYLSPEAEYGHRLYVIKSDIRSDTVGQFIAAGLGWYQLEDGRGLFVEHEFKGITQVAVESEITKRIYDSLNDLCDFRNLPFDRSKVNMSLSITQVIDHPTCALVLAVYKAEGWL